MDDDNPHRRTPVQKRELVRSMFVCDREGTRIRMRLDAVESVWIKEGVLYIRGVSGETYLGTNSSIRVLEEIGMGPKQL